ncbi:hypothetical protein EDC94DRAFT_103131 [Helicostylum pulchrum]|nr:hypothetical protein EDC94DRAFT_103131 [Helicostylum pulchrum]
MSSYGTLGNQEDGILMLERTWREKLGEKLESQKFHIAVLSLVAVDTICVAIQIIYTFFHECQAPQVLSTDKEGYLFVAFEMAEVIGISICFLFLLECALCLVAFGPRYYLPGWPHWKLHVFDAFVVLTTLILEVGLRGKEREIAGLLIIFRLWRVVKVVESVIKSVSYAHEEELEALKESYQELETKLKIQEEKNRQLLNELGQ